MARIIERLTAVSIRQTKKCGLHSDGGGLNLKVTETGSKSFVFRYSIQGDEKRIGLGSIHTVSLAEAREKAKAARQMLLEGIDPGKANRESRAAKMAVPTFSEACTRYISAKKSEWTNKKHQDTWESSLRMHIVPTIGTMRVDAVQTGDVVQALEKIWTTMPETASRTRQRVEKIFDWCKTSGYRTAENPARWRGCLEHLLPNLSKTQRTENQPALDWRRIPEFMKALESEDGSAAQALKLVILCAMRSGEARLLRWGDVDMTGKVITIPGDRMKAGKEHRIPLSAESLRLLKGLHRIEGEELVFSGRKLGEPMSDATMLRVVQRINADREDKFLDPKTGKPVVVHGFRASFKTWATEATAYPRDLVESALAHRIESKTEAAYQRGDVLDKRRKMMSQWAAYATGPVMISKVLGIRGAS